MLSLFFRRPLSAVPAFMLFSSIWRLAVSTLTFHFIKTVKQRLTNLDIFSTAFTHLFNLKLKYCFY